MVTSMDNQNLESLLKNIKSRNGSTNLYEHLGKMYQVKKEMNDDIKYSDLFEDISLRIKHSGKYDKNSSNIPKSIPSQKIKELLSPLSKAEGEGAEKTLVTNINFVPDYLDLFQKFSFCGISLGNKESLLLTNSLRNLSSTLSGGSVTFFGKIYGTKKDYYIAEGTDIDPASDANYENDMEKRKEDGFNRNVYFVTNDLCEKWVDGAKLVPSINHYTIEDPEAPYKMLTQAEKPKKFTNEILCDLNYWIHYPPGVLNCGRVSHIIDDAPEGIEPEDYKKKIIEKDPFDKRLEPVANDRKIKIGILGSEDYLYMNPWRIEQEYEDNVYINPYIKLLDETQPDFDPLEQKENKMNYSCIVVKSLRWPGAFNIYSNKETYFFYFGYGMKQEDNNISTSNISNDYCFKKFPDLPTDIKDKEDQPEPHLLNPPQPEQNAEKK